MRYPSHMATTPPVPPITSPQDPRLARMGQERVAGADQLAARLASTPDERLDSVTACAEFVREAREQLRQRAR